MYIHTCIYIYIHVYICINVCIYINIYSCVFLYSVSSFVSRIETQAFIKSPHRVIERFRATIEDRFRLLSILYL